MREGIRLGYTVPSVIMEGSLESVDAHVVKNSEQSLLFEPLKSLPTTVPASEHERLKAAGRDATPSM